MMPISLENIKKNIERIAKSPKGLIAMCTICFLEPIILPIFPEIALAPVLIARKDERIKILLIALLCTLMGSLSAYTMGYFLGNVIIGALGNTALDLYMKGRAYLHYYGLFLPLIGSMLPFPLKVISWTCGLSHFNLFIFVGAIFLGRLVRYSLIFLINKIPTKKQLKKLKIKRNDGQ
jgi:membrane protein YqaA with SNARE-associated domain